MLIASGRDFRWERFRMLRRHATVQATYCFLQINVNDYPDVSKEDLVGIFSCLRGSQSFFRTASSL